MTRVTLEESLVKRLEAVKASSHNWRLNSARGLDDVIAFLVEDYEQRRSIELQLQQHDKATRELLGTAIEEGVKKALKQWISNLLSFGGSKD